MSEQLVHELFRSLENTVHERLAMAEDLLQKKNAPDLAELVRIQGHKIDSLTNVIHTLTERISILSTLKANDMNHPFVNVSALPPPPVFAAPVVATPASTIKNVYIGPSVSAVQVHKQKEVKVEEEVEEEGGGGGGEGGGGKGGGGGGGGGGGRGGGRT